MSYETCCDVSVEIWNDLRARDRAEILARTGVNFTDGVYHLPFLNRTLLLAPEKQQVTIAGADNTEPGFRLCLTAILYLSNIDPALLGPGISPLDLPGGVTFFRGHHAVPNASLEERFGRDVAGFLAAGAKLGAEPRPEGDAALMFTIFPGLRVKVILWAADDEFPARVTFTLPAHLDKFWFLDAIWGLLNLVTQELLGAAMPDKPQESPGVQA